MPNFSFGAGMAGPTNTPNQAAASPSSPPVQGSDMLTMFLRALAQHQQSQDQLGHERLQQQGQQTFGRHLDMGGQPITGDSSPWGGPLKFQSADDRLTAMKGYGTPTGVPPRTDAASNPYATGPLGPAHPDQVTDGGAFSPTTIPRIGGGFEGMINPNLSQDQKYKQPNMFSARPGVSSLPLGAVAGDGTTNYKRKGSAFSFGAGMPKM